MFIKLTVPSKTFLLGEYLALYGGEVLIVTTQSKFSMQVSKAITPKISGIGANSPAQRFINQCFTALQPLQIVFKDPYQGRGGLGASSAQYLLSYALHHYLTQKNLLSPLTHNIGDLISCYQSHNEENLILPPSGADLIAQLMGQICYYHKKTGQFKTYNWPFTELGFYLLKTNFKIATYKHLQTLKSFPHQPFEICMKAAMDAFKDSDAKKFSAKVNDYAQLLEDEGFVTNSTSRLLNTIRSKSGVIAAKGCGAMGADVILVLCKNKCRHIVTTWASEHGLTLIGDESEVAQSGLDIEALP